jgi:hypothetical protein
LDLASGWQLVLGVVEPEFEIQKNHPYVAEQGQIEYCDVQNARSPTARIAFMKVHFRVLSEIVDFLNLTHERSNYVFVDVRRAFCLFF